MWSGCLLVPLRHQHHGGQRALLDAGVARVPQQSPVQAHGVALALYVLVHQAGEALQLGQAVAARVQAPNELFLRAVQPVLLGLQGLLQVVLDPLQWAPLFSQLEAPLDDVQLRPRGGVALGQLEDAGPQQAVRVQDRLLRTHKHPGQFLRQVDLLLQVAPLADVGLLAPLGAAVVLHVGPPQLAVSFVSERLGALQLRLGGRRPHGLVDGRDLLLRHRLDTAVVQGLGRILRLPWCSCTHVVLQRTATRSRR
mmetsp:Transcript_15920/g.45449  ORF Transcript_15920/g.45449 Transcript_15920/m.45449 type:complete len:253 (-) Transcript_15920:25-783(-)